MNPQPETPAAIRFLFPLTDAQFDAAIAYIDPLRSPVRSITVERHKHQKHGQH